nr:tRNA-dihydrouridine synthase [uncultured Anaeromusa sp.]
MLFTPYAIANLKLKNRIVMPPMCMYKAAADGKVTDWHLLHYASRAAGQVGLIIVEATAVEGRGRISAQDLGLWEDGQVEGMKKLVAAVHAQGGKIGVQLAHAGRKSTVPDSVPVAPSTVKFDESCQSPQALTLGEIDEIIAAFGAAARRAIQVGFDLIEVHGAHGYLINEFLSPLTNFRTDAYGGSVLKRAKLLREVLTEVRRAVPEHYPVTVRVSAEEYHPLGNNAVVVADMLNLVKDLGIDLVNVSSGGVVPIQPRAYASYQIPLALTIKEQTSLPILAGGLVTQAAQAQQILKAGADLVYLGRALLRQPYWALQAAHELQQEIEWPEPYVRGKF